MATTPGEETVEPTPLRQRAETVRAAVAGKRGSLFMLTMLAVIAFTTVLPYNIFAAIGAGFVTGVAYRIGTEAR